jgi:hypothetical protein
MNRECKSKASAMAMAKASPSVWPAESCYSLALSAKSKYENPCDR